MTQSIKKFSRLNALISMLGVYLIAPNLAIANEIPNTLAQPTHSITQQPNSVESLGNVPHDDKNSNLITQAVGVTEPTSTRVKDVVVSHVGDVDDGSFNGVMP
ncbi:MAG: hypothetical protein LWW76_00040 [Burkholderiales bacterium]|nr:hypothetical protein [Burkholderiales bacterium]